MNGSAETESAPGAGTSAEVFESLRLAFVDFQVRSEKLERAYGAMQEDFKKVNLELDRKNLELESSLTKQEEVQTYLDSILQAMDNGVVGVDTEGVITHFNAAAALVTGFEPEAVLGRRYSDVFAGKKSESAVLSTLESGREVKRDERILWTKTNQPVPILYHTAVLKDRTGKKLGAVEVFSDMSRVKALEKEMHQAKTMAALGEMSATVAHEIRNPLGAMGVWAGLLERDIEPGDPRRKTLGRITEGLSKLNKIVSNLLVYTRPMAAEFRKIPLYALLEEIVDFTQIEIERLGRDITVQKNFAGFEELHVLVDPEKINQAVINLCLNAVQAMENGGTLSVEIERDVNESRYVSFSVSDTGLGISKENLGKIFDPFFTTKEDGTGLGLAIVKKIIESHGGLIDIKSERV
ncbi:MAG: PAS domain-containing protein [Chitinispirillales bacterium]|nr:PAS domain-containing protein [Chitinispirillales bacterium]